MKTSPSSFAKKVYELCSQIPRGKVTTYREIARALNNSPRAVGQALRRNPYAPQVPCHRVVRSDGTLGGFFGHLEGEFLQRKIDLLKEEGVLIQNASISSLEVFFHSLGESSLPVSLSIL